MKRQRPRVITVVVGCLFLLSLLGGSHVAAQAQTGEEVSRILFVASAPTWEYRLLQRQLHRSNDVVLSCWLQSLKEDRPQEGNERLASFPDASTLSNFEAIILLDPDPQDFSDEWMNEMRAACQRGTGVLYIAGPKHSARFLARESLSTFRDILPVEVPAVDPESPAPSDLRTGNLRPVEEHLDHSILKLATDADENRQLWDSLPGIFWSFPVTGTKAESRVLLQHPDDSPALVTGNLEDGKVVFMSFSGTWRWRRAGHQAEHFERFWNNVTELLVHSG